MGWQDRRYEPSDGGGKFRTVIRRIFGDGENPLDWSIPLYTAWGIRVRVHLVFVILVVGKLVQAAAPKNGIGVGETAIGIGCLFALVLLHEYGHCIACRRVGGTANDILMWPLGGLAMCMPPTGWKPSLITTLGGPAVNLALLPVFGAAVLMLGQDWRTLLPNPIDPTFAISTLHAADNGMLRVVWWTWWLYFTNLILLLFNMLVPMYPMDGARVVLAILWRKMGYHNAAMIVVKLGYFTALVLGVYGAAIQQTQLVVIAIFGASMCFMERRRLAMMDEGMQKLGYNFDGGYSTLPSEETPVEAERVREKRVKQEQEDQEELDRILAKIAKTGMASLTKAEKKWLERASERRRVR